VGDGDPVQVTAFRSSTAGWGGVTIEAPTSLTHGMCATFTLQHTGTQVGSLSPQPAPSAETLTVTATNGDVFIDGMCDMQVPGGAISFPSGSVSASFGFKPTQAGSCEITVSGPTNSYIQSSMTVSAN
jgi:hypothetical protein